MSACLIVLGVLIGCAGTGHDGWRGEAPQGSAHQEEAPDRWLAEDKFQHFTVSAAATTMGYGGARLALEPGPARTAAAATALGLGILKEVADVRRGGPFSLKDLAWDAAGVALGLTLIHGTR